MAECLNIVCEHMYTYILCLSLSKLVRVPLCRDIEI